MSQKYDLPELGTQTVNDLAVQWAYEQKDPEIRIPTSGIVDATNLSPGRLASTIAKNLLKCKTCTYTVKNVGMLRVKGNLADYVERYTALTSLHHHTRGPFYSRRASMLFRNMVKRMLPFSKHGVHALRRLRVEGALRQILPEAPIYKGFYFIDLVKRLNGGVYVA